MSSVEILYQKVYSRLKSFCERSGHIDDAITIIFQKCQEEHLTVDKRKKEQLKENAEREIKLKAFINIARAHSSNLEEADEMVVYDSGILSRLAVQINNASKNDPFARQLFTHASGQLRYIRQDVYQIEYTAEETKWYIERQLQIKQSMYEKEREKLTKEVKEYFCSNEFKTFIDSVELDYSIFGSCIDVLSEKIETPEHISIGIKRAQLPVPSVYVDELIKYTHGKFDSITKTIGIPVCINMMSGSGIIIDYKNENENILLSGLHNIILNLARYYENVYEQIIYVDPVRFNKGALGILQPLATGTNNSFISNVPLSFEEVRRTLVSVIANINADVQKIGMQKGNKSKKRFLLFHNFPQAYDSTMIRQIQQLFVNAASYNITIIATHNCSVKNAISSEALAFIRTNADYIECEGYQFSVKNAWESAPFEWYSAPSLLPEGIKHRYVDEKTETDISNNYESRLGFEGGITYEKGVRQIVNIPYGIDNHGNILSLDFENSNFATFICGVARSGKSTLLHTLITGLIKNIHPDDIEIWLIDFKMTEFSRYINHMPPHIRYIILDESPELVYDIINRLTEIMTKRQNIFKGKWQKLSEVPPEKYMPAILVIIDEFSVMSQIIADSEASGRENYSIKLQTLLAKGAALGLHFVFASQGFTSGTRGLNDFSKKQIQQRIAMKAEYNEIKETLDLKSASDEDKTMMEQLVNHHALVRVPIDNNGNHLRLTEVLYIPDYSKQEVMIDSINDMFVAAPRYDVYDITSYIDKKSMYVDGNNYTSFISKEHEFIEFLESRSDVLSNALEDEVIFFLGEPRRMLSLYPVEVVNGFGENILMIAPVNEKMPVTSVLMSIARSLVLEGKAIDVWTTGKNTIYRQLVVQCKQRIRSLSRDLDEVCDSIRALKKRIQTKIEDEKYIILLGFETLLMDMSYQSDVEWSSTNQKGDNKDELTVEKREPGEMDLIARLDSMREGKTMTQENNLNTNKQSAIKRKENTSTVYDARSDLKFILTQGPRLGYHFIMLFNSVGELKQSKLDLSLFKHKVLFRLPKAEAVDIIGTSGAGIVSELDDHSFRYTNGLEALSLRPYLHQGLSWDGWQMKDGEVTNFIEQEEYLL